MGFRFIGEAPMPRGKSTRGMDGLGPAGEASPAWSAGGSRGKAKQGTPCGIGPCPMKRALGVRGARGRSIHRGSPDATKGEGVRGRVGLRPAGVAWPAWSAGGSRGKAKQGTPCGIGPCPMKRALGVRGARGRSFHRGSPDATGGGCPGQGWPRASRDGFASIERREKPKRGTPCGIGPCPMKRALGVRGAGGRSIHRGSPDATGGRVSGAWMASGQQGWLRQHRAQGKAKAGHPCGIGPCPMKRALGVRKARGRSFHRGSPDATGGVRGRGGLGPAGEAWPAGSAGGRQSRALLVASGLAR